jgi:predicted anti-sigma-YlaC factor YlaD
MSGQEHGFDQALISGYIDGELTQGDAQRVRLHLEDCAGCRQMADDLRRLKETTMTTEFRVPEDTQWDETPRNTASRILHNFGWFLAIVWVAGVVAYVVWQMATDSESIQLEGMLGFAILLAFGLIILSALIDRLKTRKTDPYRKVKK